MANERTPTSQRDAAGLAARRIASDILDGVLRRHRPLDEQLDDRAAQADFAALAHRDRALVRALATVVLRRLGTLRHLLGHWLKLPADAPRVETALLLGAAPARARNSSPPSTPSRSTRRSGSWRAG